MPPESNFPGPDRPGFSAEEVEKLADRARLKLAPDEIPAAVRALDDILNLVARMERDDSGGGKPVRAFAQTRARGGVSAPKSRSNRPASPLQNPETAGLRELAQALRNREISPSELGDFFRARIRKFARLNAFVHIQDDDEAESEFARNRNSGFSLRGIPIAHKDLFCVKGVRTTCGARILDSFIAPCDATAVQKCADAGMRVVGKTNMDEFGIGSSGERSCFGPTRNPWDETRSPGGSSSGSAVAVAAGLAPVATGSDTGGSIRQPAAFCGVTGIKPTFGRVSRRGFAAFTSSFCQGGIFARRAEDCALALNAVCGFDPRDSMSLKVPDEDFAREIGDGGSAFSMKGKTIGVPREFFGDGLGLAEEVAQKNLEAILEFEKMGATIRDISLPSLSAAYPAYYALACAETAGIFAGHDDEQSAQGPLALVNGLGPKARGEGFGREPKLRILAGTFMRSSEYGAERRRCAAKIRRRVADDFGRAFAEECDVVMGPVALDAAFKLGEIPGSDPVRMCLQDVFLVPANLAGLPAMSIPCGLTAAGMPVGLQLIGPRLQEARMLGFAHQYQLRADFHLRTPNLKESAQ